MDSVRGLVGKWRDSARWHRCARIMGIEPGDELDKCADELEAALAKQPAPDVARLRALQAVNFLANAASAKVDKADVDLRCETIRSALTPAALRSDAISVADNAALIVAAVNALPALLDERDALAAEVAWRPIESAPKDERVLLWDGKYVSAGAYTDYDCMGWCMDCYDVLEDSEPTHWMPLPAAPSAKGVAP